MDTNLGRVVESIRKELNTMQPVLRTNIRDYREDALIEVFLNDKDDWFIAQLVARLSEEHPEYLIGCASNAYKHYMAIMQKDGTTKYVLMIIS